MASDGKICGDVSKGEKRKNVNLACEDLNKKKANSNDFHGCGLSCQVANNDNRDPEADFPAGNGNAQFVSVCNARPKKSRCTVGLKMYKCDYCTVIEKEMGSMISHLSEHNHYSASLCTTKLLDNGHYEIVHIEEALACKIQENREKALWVVCSICEEIFPDIFTCGLHSQLKHDTSTADYTRCPIIKTETVTLDEFYICTCTVCGERFMKKTEKLQHEKAKVGHIVTFSAYDAENCFCLYECLYCPVVYKSCDFHDAKNHVVVHHTKNKEKKVSGIRVVHLQHPNKCTKQHFMPFCPMRKAFKTEIYILKRQKEFLAYSRKGSRAGVKFQKQEVLRQIAKFQHLKVTHLSSKSNETFPHKFTHSGSLISETMTSETQENVKKKKKTQENKKDNGCGNGPNKFKCDYCPHAENDYDSMLSHLVESSHYAASLCTYKLLDNGQNEFLHVDKQLACTVDGNKGRVCEVVCPACSEIFPDIYICGLHSKMKHCTETEDYTLCPVVKRDSVIVGVYRCATCNEIMKTNDEIKQHFKINMAHNQIPVLKRVDPVIDKSANSNSICLFECPCCPFIYGPYDFNACSIHVESHFKQRKEMPRINIKYVAKPADCDKQHNLPNCPFGTVDQLETEISVLERHKKYLKRRVKGTGIKFKIKEIKGEIDQLRKLIN